MGPMPPRTEGPWSQTPLHACEYNISMNNKPLIALWLIACCSLSGVVHAKVSKICKDTTRKMAKIIISENDAAAMKSELQILVKDAGLDKISVMYAKSLKESKALEKDADSMTGELNQKNELKDYEAMPRVAKEIARIAEANLKLYNERKELERLFFKYAKSAIKRNISTAKVGDLPVKIILRKNIPHYKQLDYRRPVRNDDCRGTMLGTEFSVSYSISTGQYKVQIENHVGEGCGYSAGLGYFISYLHPSCEFSEVNDKEFLNSLSVLE